MKFILSSVFIGASFLPAMQVIANEEAKLAFEQCRKLVQPNRRLDCYDKLDIDRLLSDNKPKFTGKHTVKTDIFTIEEPTILRYHSDGAIFVLAIHDRSGEVIKNLHIGGGGEDSYLIQTPGEYFLQVNGSTTWQIWLDQP